MDGETRSPQPPSTAMQFLALYLSRPVLGVTLPHHAILHRSTSALVLIVLQNDLGCSATQF